MTSLMVIRGITQRSDFHIVSIKRETWHTLALYDYIWLQTDLIVRLGWLHS